MSEQKTQIKRGDKVAIINQKMSGEFFLEGFATVRVAPRNTEDMALVQFDDNDTGELVERWIDPTAQASPKEYIAKLNSAPA